MLSPAEKPKIVLLNLSTELRGDCEMSDAVRLMVDTWVNLKDRQSIEQLRDHRLQLQSSFREKEGRLFDSTKRVIESDLKEVRALIAAD